MGLMTSHSQKVDLNMAPGTKHCEFHSFSSCKKLWFPSDLCNVRSGAGQDGNDHSVGSGPRPSHIHPGALQQKPSGPIYLYPPLGEGVLWLALHQLVLGAEQHCGRGKVSAGQENPF